ncbi:MAG: GYF domain-containing protein [Planctomycetota bacterium]
MTRWFIQRNGESEDVGPLRPSELLEMVRNGDVRPETMLRKDDSAYFQASDVGGLFEAAMRPTIQYYCPQCKREITEPPVTCPHCDFNVTRALTRITENTITNPEEQRLTEQAGNSVKRWLRRKQAARTKQKED